MTTTALDASTFESPAEVAEDELSPVTRKDLLSSVADAASFNVMVGMGETFIAPFAIALGTGNISTGLLTTVPIFAGSILQLVTPRMVQRVGSHQKWVVACAIMQGLSLLLLPFAIFLGGWSAALVYIAATLYWAAGQAGNPAWNTWIEDVIPKYLRTRFFAQRSRISQMCLLAGFVISGLLLEYGKAHTFADTINWTLVVFAGLFITAALCRFTSAYFLTQHSEPNRGKLSDEHISLAQWRRRLGEHSGAKLLMFLFAMQAAVFISGPYFTPYMLKELKLSYVPYMIVISSSLLGKAIGLPFWGRIAHRYGARRLLYIGAFSIIPLSSLWIVSTSFAWVLFVQAISGLLWAAFELAIVLMFFEAIPRHERTSLVTLYNLSNSSAMVCGTLVGALILAYGNYYVMFGLSSFCRIFAVMLLVRLSNVTDVVPREVEGALALHPAAQNFDKPIMAGIPETAEEDLVESPAPRAA